MNLKNQILVIAGVLALGTITSCKEQEEPTTTTTSTTAGDCDGITPTYTLDVKPIMDVSCAISGCHNSTDRKEGLDYSTYALVKSLATDDAFVGSMNHTRGFKKMPEDRDKLSDEQLKALSCWIQNGMPEN